MKIKKFFISILSVALFILLSPVFLFAQYDDSSGINSGNHGLHLRGSLGAGQIFWGYISHGSSSGDLGTGPGAAINLAAMYNYSALALELNLLSGNISDLEWKDKDGGTEYTYKSTGTGYYSVMDFKIGAKLFAEPGDMGYTFIYAGKRYWSSSRKQESIEWGIFKNTSTEERKAEGDGWIFGFRDFSTLGMDGGFAIAIQSGLFLGKAPVSKMSTDGADQSYPVRESLSLGMELGAGIAMQNIGLSVIGGFRGEINATTFKDSAAPTGEESIFGFGNIMLFVEAGIMF